MIHTQTTWLGRAAHMLADAALRVVIVPEMGAKIVSLFDVARGLEWLAGPGERPFRPVAYGAQFDQQDMSGWDEMFPTIRACAYPQPGRYLSAPLPDHGEVWCMPWQMLTAEDALVSAVQGRALPYRLERRLSLPSPGMLQMDYTLENQSDEDMPFLWAAHPQFATGDLGRIILPDQAAQVCNVLPPEWGWGAIEQRLPWPEAMLPDGSPVRLDTIGPPSLKRARKFFALPEARLQWCEVVRLPEEARLRLAWDAETAPYFGLWVDEGALNQVSVAAPEPMTGFYDSLTLAHRNQAVLWAAAGEIKHWRLRVMVS